MFSMYQVFLLTLALGDLGHCRLDSSPVLVREVPNHARSQNVAIVAPEQVGECRASRDNSFPAMARREIGTGVKSIVSLGIRRFPSRTSK